MLPLRVLSAEGFRAAAGSRMGTVSEGDRDLDRIYEDALRRVDFDADVAKQIVAMRIEQRRPEDAAIHQQLEDEVFLDMAVGALHKLMQVDPEAGRRFVRSVVTTLYGRGYRPAPSSPDQDQNPALRWRDPVPPAQP